MKNSSNATVFYCDWNNITLSDLDAGDWSIIKMLEAFAKTESISFWRYMDKGKFRFPEEHFKRYLETPKS